MAVYLDISFMLIVLVFMHIYEVILNFMLPYIFVKHCVVVYIKSVLNFFFVISFDFIGLVYLFSSF